MWMFCCLTLLISLPTIGCKADDPSPIEVTFADPNPEPIEVTFADSNFEACVRSYAVSITSDARMSNDDLSSLTTLQCGLYEITDLSGAEYLTNLTGLWLYNNQISDVSPLSGLTNLTQLYLSGNEISDVSPLSGLTNLTNLNLSYNQISDVSPLSGLTNLTLLYLNVNEISDVKIFVTSFTCENSTQIYLHDNPLDVGDCLDIYSLIEKGCRVNHHIPGC